MALSYDQQMYYRRTNQDLGIPEGNVGFSSDVFTGDGATTNFALAHTPDQTNYTPLVTVNGAVQSSSQFSISTSTLVFVTAPTLGLVVRCNYQY